MGRAGDLRCEIDFPDGGDGEFGLLRWSPDEGVRGYVIIARTIYRFSPALFALVTHDDGASPHLRNAGTTRACSSVGSFRLVRVSLVRLAPALYPIF
jgi:hypothetical protein